ncbi:MAG: acetoin utilization protein AcuC [Actinomycetota bacterium]|nr:acetoin utilization protein AcuC [Actinomycetota bacterium]
MSESVQVVWDDVFTTYDFGVDHPLKPLRLELTMALARELGVLSGPTVTVVPPQPADDALLELVHDPLYIAAVRRAPDDLLGRLSMRHGLGTPDNPIFAGMHEAGAMVTGASVDAARAVWSGAAQHAVNIAGGLHHAMRDRASGFCIYDDPAVAIAWLLAQGAGKVAYVDVDVHHGDGVQAAFYRDPRVLTISLHESRATLFPGTGWPGEWGAGAAVGTSVNVALPAGTGDAGWLRAFHAVVPPLVRAFAPDLLVSQLGCDTHVTDPLANLRVTVDAHRQVYATVHRLAHEACGGRWLAVGGGGYQAVRVVPRAWTLALAEAAGVVLAPRTATPDGWRQLARSRSGGSVPPESMTDGADPAYDVWQGGTGDPADPVDRAVSATRAAVFAEHGLDPLAPEAA